MPDELTGIIEAAVADAHEGGIVDEALVVETLDGDGNAEVVAEGDGDEGAEVVDPNAEGAEVTEGDDEPAAVIKEPVKEKELTEVEKILAEAGITAPKPGQKDNKIPYTRTVKIVGNALKKQADTHAAFVTESTGKLTAAEARVKTFEAADKLADSDPDRYMQILATINPAYKKFLTPGVAEPVIAAPVGEKAPGPDMKFDDGSVGYSPEQAQKREDWIIAQAAEKGYTRAKADFEKQFGPIKQKWDSEAATAARLPKVRERIAAAKVVWGDRFPVDGTPEQLAVSALVDKGVSFELALSQVLLPKVQETRAQIRAELLQEQAKRPAAAKTKVAASVKQVPNADGRPRDTEDVIREAIAAAGGR